jgi:hypothetical protein
MKRGTDRGECVPPGAGQLGEWLGAIHAHALTLGDKAKGEEAMVQLGVDRAARVAEIAGSVDGEVHLPIIYLYNIFMPKPKPEDPISWFDRINCLVRLRGPMYNFVEATLERVSTPGNEVSRDALIQAALLAMPRDVDAMRAILGELGTTRAIDVAWSRAERPDYEEVTEILETRARKPGRPRRSGRDNPHAKVLLPSQLSATKAARRSASDRLGSR